ncbi:transcriptional coactivator YAP1-like isoform X4 [Betta splendens]|uniref:Transcriptional coactivator YAP1-like isoform X4 n=1 Tax=Betta splendens TaxID=158456 RepID=A0A6P7PC01_BETSP|nr:transcriptional coactivator YAP1-like isoform X4 [Betta splendens]
MDAHRGAPPAGQQVVHVRGDSQTDLEALFNAAMNPSKEGRHPASLPMRMRKLPDSFFRPPEPRGHSRQASSDGGVIGSLAPHHVRAHSSPASLPVNSLSTQAADVAATPIIPDDAPLPHGWEMAKTPTGQRYFLNHLDKTTTWHDPRLSQLQSAAAQHPPVHAHSLSNPANATQQSISPETAQKMNLSLVLQQRQDKLRCEGLPPQFAPQAGGRNQVPGGMDHDRNSQTLISSLDVRIRGSNHEPALNGAHSRNESTDSGLSVSSLPRTSDHMLSPMDHMDTGDSSEPPSMVLQESMPVLPLSEGEEVMPCIPEGLGSDLLMDMDMDKDSLLTWL